MTRRGMWAVLVPAVGSAGRGNGSYPAGARWRTPTTVLEKQARDALERYDAAVATAGGEQGFVPVGALTGVIGAFEAGFAGNAKAALGNGHLTIAALTQVLALGG